MNEITLKNIEFNGIYNKSNRLAAAVFAVSNLMDKDEDLKNKIKNLSLDVVYLSVNLKDIKFVGADRVISDMEKKSLLLMSLLNIASIGGLISSMNGDVLREEFKSFISDIKTLAAKFEGSKYGVVKNVFKQQGYLNDISLGNGSLENRNFGTFGASSKEGFSGSLISDRISVDKNGGDANPNNGHKRKDLRKIAILDFIKRHNEVGIKDIVPNVVGCSEKTIQRELINLINEGKIKKSGEKRWSKYSAT